MNRKFTVLHVNTPNVQMGRNTVKLSEGANEQVTAVWCSKTTKGDSLVLDYSTAQFELVCIATNVIIFRNAACTQLR